MRAFDVVCHFARWNPLGLIYRGADKSLARPGRKQVNVSMRMAWISFRALPCEKKKTWQLASRCCWNCTRPWHAAELVSYLVKLRTYQQPSKKKKRKKWSHCVCHEDAGGSEGLVPLILNVVSDQLLVKILPLRKRHWHALHRKLGSFLGQCECCGEHRILLPWWELHDSSIIQPIV